MSSSNEQELFNLRWHNHQNHILKAFEVLLRTKALVDVTLVADDSSIQAHKIVLSACSPFFQRIITENPCKHPVIVLKDFRGWVIQAVVDFMYRGEINIPQEQLKNVLQAGQALQIRGLVDHSLAVDTPTPAASPSADDDAEVKPEAPLLSISSKLFDDLPRRKQAKPRRRSEDFSPPPMLSSHPPRELRRKEVEDEEEAENLTKKSRLNNNNDENLVDNNNRKLHATNEMFNPLAAFDRMMLPFPPFNPPPFYHLNNHPSAAAQHPPLKVQQDHNKTEKSRGMHSPGGEMGKESKGALLSPFGGVMDDRPNQGYFPYPPILPPPHLMNMDPHFALLPHDLNRPSPELADSVKSASSDLSSVFFKKKISRIKGQHSAPRGGPPRSWTNTELTQALENVWNKKMTTSQASRIFGIPYNSLLMYVRGKYGKSLKLEELRKDCISGPPIEMLQMNPTPATIKERSKSPGSPFPSSGGGGGGSGGAIGGAFYSDFGVNFFGNALNLSAKPATENDEESASEKSMDGSTKD